MLRALAKDPAHRFADATEFLTALEGARQAQLASIGSATAEFGVVPEPIAYEPAPGEPAHAPYEPIEPLGRGRAWPWVLATVVVIGAAIAAFLLLGSSKQHVPNVVGQTEPAAAAILMRSGFGVVQRSQPSATVTRGDVIATFPGARASASKGSTVTLIVSSGPGVVTVPNVVSLGRHAATQVLRASGLRSRRGARAVRPAAPRSRVLDRPGAADRGAGGLDGDADDLLGQAAGDGAPRRRAGLRPGQLGADGGGLPGRARGPELDRPEARHGPHAGSRRGHDAHEGLVGHPHGGTTPDQVSVPNVKGKILGPTRSTH